MRGARKDVSVTKVLVANGIFWDKRSFVSLPRLDGSIHVYLKGDDIKLARQRVWQRSKQKCAICKRPISFDQSDADWEMDHIKGGNVERCDCLENLQAVHRECHRNKHVQVKFTPKQQTQETADESNREANE